VRSLARRLEATGASMACRRTHMTPVLQKRSHCCLHPWASAANADLSALDPPKAFGRGLLQVERKPPDDGGVGGAVTNETRLQRCYQRLTTPSTQLFGARCCAVYGGCLRRAYSQTRA
jgi:hypothetical protein